MNVTYVDETTVAEITTTKVFVEQLMLRDRQGREFTIEATPAVLSNGREGFVTRVFEGDTINKTSVPINRDALYESSNVEDAMQKGFEYVKSRK
jgi:hypothetical protein